MASENSNGCEQSWIPLPSLPRISVASNSRARLAHRRPISLFLPSKCPPISSSPSDDVENSKPLNTCVGQLVSTDSWESNSAPAFLSSLPPSVSSGVLGTDSDSGLAPICEQAKLLVPCSFAPVFSPVVLENGYVSAVSDCSVNVTAPASPHDVSRGGSPVSAKPCDDSKLNPPTSSEALPQSCVSVVNVDSQRLQQRRVEEIEFILLGDEGETQTSSQNDDPDVLSTVGAGSCEEDSPSLAQSFTVQVKKVAELNKNLGPDSEESEPEEGQLSGEWSGSDDSVEESNGTADNILEDCSTTPLRHVGEQGFAVENIAKLTRLNFPLGNISSLPSFPTSKPPGIPSRKTGTTEKKRKRHKKGEGAKKRAREKSAQKYKEKKKQRINTDCVEQQGEAPVARLGKDEQSKSQNARRNIIESVNQASKSHATSNNEEVVEEGEISEPTQISTGLLSSLVEAEVGLWTTDDIDDQMVAQMEEDLAVKKKRGPESAERKLKRKIAKRKKRAKKEKELGIRKRRPEMSKPPVKVLCTHFMKGRCAKGEKCPFSHDAVPLTKQEPCKFLMSRSCLKGDDCPFSHNLKEFPCKFFHTRGLCYDGDRCLFSHGPITEEEREKLLKRVEKDKERGNNASVFDLPTPDFSSSLPADEDPDPLGWGTANSCPSFDVDFQQRCPGGMDGAKYSVEAEYGVLPNTSYHEHSDWVQSSAPVYIAEDVGIHSADHHTNNEDTPEKLECRNLEHTTAMTTTAETVESNVTSSATETSAVTLVAPIFPMQRGSRLVNRALELKKSLPSLTPTTESRKLTVESLLGEVLKY